jgi:hypothetical protein
MSELEPGVITCPRCPASWSAALFRSVDADTIPVQVDAILDGSFEHMTCAACGHGFRPEHPLLFASHARRLWIVMLPLADRRGFATLERDVERVIADGVAAAAPLVAERLRGLRPRLVFGQHMLSEAVRAAHAGLDASLLECAKLLAVRRNLPAMLAYGPFELCFERFEGSVPICAVHAVPSGVRAAEIALPGEILAEANARQAELRAAFPDLFERPYVSASRYLLSDTV